MKKRLPAAGGLAGRGCVTVQLCKCVSVKVPRCQGVKVPGCQSVKVSGCEGVRVRGCERFFWFSTGAEGLTAPRAMGRGEENRVFAAREKLFSRRFTCSNASHTLTGTWSRGSRSECERARAGFRILRRWYLWGPWCLWLLWFLCRMSRPTGAASGLRPL